MSIFSRDLGGGDDGDGPSSITDADLEEKEEPECPPGLRQYETMVILRPNMSEDERLAFTHKYEQVNFLFLILFLAHLIFRFLAVRLFKLCN